ncbi:hypothetical protein QBC41DRAFT_64008 [Cercophora samala]|uniref:Uncharacterized protein n=1 Tax=Cercophora samala TaxID=330535 RepID=A0AA40DEB8_9PEZI|nr:hypothetical protein QBC41DRAFT_64008 [Cercophora samala]
MVYAGMQSRVTGHSRTVTFFRVHTVPGSTGWMEAAERGSFLCACACSNGKMGWEAITCGCFSGWRLPLTAISESTTCGFCSFSRDRCTEGCSVCLREETMAEGQLPNELGECWGKRGGERMHMRTTIGLVVRENQIGTMVVTYKFYLMTGHIRGFVLFVLVILAGQIVLFLCHSVHWEAACHDVCHHPSSTTEQAGLLLLCPLFAYGTLSHWAYCLGSSVGLMRAHAKTVVVCVMFLLASAAVGLGRC